MISSQTFQTSMASDTLKELLIGESIDAELEREINSFEKLASFIESENQVIDGERSKPRELPGQMQKIREDQVRNTAGGYVFKVNDLNRIRRFLILGTEGGTYYSSEKELTIDNVKAMCEIIEKGKGPLLLREIIRISLEGRAPKQDPTLFALALCARYKVRDTTRPNVYHHVMKKYKGKTLTEKDCEAIVNEVQERMRKSILVNERSKVAGDGFEQQAPQEAYDDYQKALQKMAFRAVLKVCRIPTHLFTFVGYCQKISAETGAKQNSKGWGRGLRTAIAYWYFNHTPEDLARLITKYQQRNKFCHRDLLRLCHLRPKTSFPTSHEYWRRHKEFDFIFAYIVGDIEEGHKRKAEAEGNGIKKAKSENRKEETDEQRKKREEKERERVEKQMARMKLREEKIKVFSELKLPEAPDVESSAAAKLIRAFEEMKTVTDPEKAASLIREYGLVREHVPSNLLNSKPVWEALIADMAMTALIRNLGKLASIDMINDKEENRGYVLKVISQLTDKRALHKARVHPISILLASAVYKSGGGYRGKLHWETNPQITAALEKAFLLAFANVTPTNKRYCLALDVSGSMSSNVLNSFLSCREAAAGMSMVLLKTEPKVESVAFSDGLTELHFDQSTTIDQMLERVNNMDFSSTDCALPMLWAAEKKKEFDVFVIYTDCETWFGDVHPFKALQQYREQMNIRDAKLVVMGMTSTGFTIADPTDPGMLDICGFDSAVPELLKEFVLGNI
uniref:TROVE domain-containing protein n=3 Tax=Parascaris univalens TaxID=6257 RepID=A0A915B918_PARUN